MVQLECMSEDDFSMIVEWFGRESPDLLLQWAGPTFTYPLTVEQLLNHYSEGINHETSRTFVYKIMDELTGEAAGMIQLCRIDRTARTAVVERFWIQEHLRNKGVGTAALRKLIDKAVQQFQLRQLSLRVFDFNLPAIKCYEKLRICTRNEKVCQASNGERWSDYEMRLMID
ncbi:MAG: N-acetyltransferase [Thermobacillus sp.]|uniref:GNAT family N-acetyltransferase n=1 Tax=Thermobacillus sp. TaxID=2108467 RepID=UPI000E3B02B2|nr:GNAT family protein [Thermobacillus sp.]REK55338.1 MAG: N-acetyltransferase [Thermobacillus sp.]